jgi:hypothetical protein
MTSSSVVMTNDLLVLLFCIAIALFCCVCLWVWVIYRMHFFWERFLTPGSRTRTLWAGVHAATRKKPTQQQQNSEQR